MNRVPGAKPIAIVDLVIIASVLAAVMITVMRLQANVWLLPPLSGETLVLLAAAGGLYVVAHILRTVRLYLFLTGGLVGSSVPFKALLGFQATLSLLTFGMPWKLGDVIRLADLFRLSGDDLRAAYALWFDRLADSLLIVGLLLLLRGMGLGNPATTALLGVTGGFLALSLAALIAAPGALAAVCRACVSATSVATLRLLRAAVFVRKLLDRAPQLDRGTFSLVAALTLGVWCLEIGTVTLVAVALARRASLAPERFMLILTHLFEFASPVTPEGSAYFVVACVGLLALSAFTVGAYLRRRLDMRQVTHKPKPYPYEVPFGVRANLKGRLR